MKPIRRSTEFTIFNPFRISISGLLLVELVLIACWWVPPPWHMIAISAVMLVAYAIMYNDRVRGYLEMQIFDRVQLNDRGVEYSSGLFGEHWIRPYNEFRVQLRKSKLPVPAFTVRLKHRVLPNIVVKSTSDRFSAEQSAKQMVENSRLKMLPG